MGVVPAFPYLEFHLFNSLLKQEQVIVFTSKQPFFSGRVVIAVYRVIKRGRNIRVSLLFALRKRAME